MRTLTGFDVAELNCNKLQSKHFHGVEMVLKV